MGGRQLRRGATVWLAILAAWSLLIAGLTPLVEIRAAAATPGFAFDLCLAGPDDPDMPGGGHDRSCCLACHGTAAAPPQRQAIEPIPIVWLPIDLPALLRTAERAPRPERAPIAPRAPPAG